MNTDITNYVAYVNQMLTNKRKYEEITEDETNELLQELNDQAFTYITTLCEKVPNIKGRELTSFIKTFLNTTNDVIFIFKNDKYVQDTMEPIYRLYIIALFSIINDIFNKINECALVDRSKNFNECFKTYVDSPKQLTAVNKSNSNTKKTKTNEEYEDVSDYESSDDEVENVLECDDLDEHKSKIKDTVLVDTHSENYGDNDNDDDDSSSSSDEEDEDDTIKYQMNPHYGKKESVEFMEQLFKSRTENSEDELLNYFHSLPAPDKKQALTQIKEINNYKSSKKHIVFDVMNLPLPLSQKNHILKQWISLTTSRYPENKLKNWFESLMNIPFNMYKGINLTSLKSSKVKKFLDNLQSVMDKAIFGHDEAKRQIIQIMGQQVRNPKSKGNMLGIWGPPGNGKSSLVKEGIAKAMDKPFVFISLGGATDSSFLEGHSYTYEGSIYGRIANGLITSKCMDPIIYFDELDKISNTHKGEEITNILIHLTDPVQNGHFRDKYFHGVDIDLSRATMIFSFNNPHNVNPILLDRITTVETKYLMTSQKVHIAQNYLLVDMMKDLGLKENDIVVTEETLQQLISKYTREGGVRKLKSLLYSICRELNIANLLKTPIDDQLVSFPFTVEPKHIKLLLKNKSEITDDKIHKHDKTGLINGLWASDMGIGGVLPIEVLWFPMSHPLEVKATGNLQQVIKESTQVASTLAFNYLSKDLQDKYLGKWKETPMGFHLHCPDGATPKDGPSAGTAITVSILSMLLERKIKHDVAITGEINLQGKVTAIGGLENKLEGAKKAGIRLALYPKENEKDMKKIIERNPKLFDATFRAQPIETLEEAINYTLV
jgi:endopeptidase La